MVETCEMAGSDVKPVSKRPQLNSIRPQAVKTIINEDVLKPFIYFAISSFQITAKLIMWKFENISGL